MMETGGENWCTIDANYRGEPVGVGTTPGLQNVGIDNDLPSVTQ